MKRWALNLGRVLIVVSVFAGASSHANCLPAYDTQVEELEDKNTRNTAISVGLTASNFMLPGLGVALQVVTSLGRTAFNVYQAGQYLDLDDLRSTRSAILQAGGHEPLGREFERLYDIASDGRLEFTREDFARTITALNENDAFCQEGVLFGQKGVLHAAGTPESVVDHRFGPFGEYLSRYQAYEAQNCRSSEAIDLTR